MICSKIYLSQSNIFLFDDLLGDFYEELQTYYDDLFMNYAEDLILDDCSYFIHDENFNIVGFYSLSPCNPNILRYLYIKLEHRKMNYGTAVIQQLLNENKILKLNCSIKNKNAINFYNKFNGSKTINNDEVTYDLKI